MRTSVSIAALLIGACAVPLSGQKLVVDSLVAVQPFGDSLRYSWPIVRIPGNYAIARLINKDLYMWGEHYVDSDTAGSRYFDGVWGDGTGGMIQMYPPEWSWARPLENVLVITITAEWCGAYCEGSTEHYHYDPRDGSRVRFDSLFTSEGLRLVKHRVREGWRKVVLEYLTALRDTAGLSPSEMDTDWSMGVIDLYERCLAERSTTEPYVSDMLIGPDGITVWVARCSAHIELASDELMEVEIPLSRAELVPLLRRPVLKWLGW